MACAGGGSINYAPEWDKFLQAIGREDSKVVMRLAKHPKIIEKTKGNLLELIITLDKNKLLMALIKKGHNINKSFGPYHNTALHIAVLNKNLDGIKLLIKNGADIEKINVFNYTPFLSALENSNEDVVKFMLMRLGRWKHVHRLNLWVKMNGQCPIRSLLRNQNTELIQYAT